MRNLFRAVPVLAALVLATTAPAHADVFSLVGGAARKAMTAAEREAVRAARLATMRAGLAAGEKAAVVEAKASGGLRLLDPESQRIHIDLDETQDVVALRAALSSVKRLVVAETVLKSHADDLRLLVARAQTPVTVMTEDGKLLALRLERVAGREALLVEIDPALAMTSEAFGRRKALEALSARPLLKRMRVLPLVSRDDVLLTRAFRTEVRQAFAPPMSKVEALNLIRKSREALLVITGHVEDDAFVVRTPTNREIFRLPIDELYRAAAEAKSEVLLLGCRAACNVPHTGPLQNVTNGAVIRSLQGVSPDASALDFMKALARDAGPILIQDDHRGGFLIIDDAVTRASDRAWARGFSPVRLAIKAAEDAGSPVFVASSRIWTWSRVFAGLIAFLLGSLIVLASLAGLGWLYAPILGLGPKGVWRSIKKERAAVLPGIDALAPVPAPSRWVYAVYGAWIPVVQRLGLLALFVGLVVFAFASWAALLITLLFMLLAIARMNEVQAAAPIGRHAPQDEHRMAVVAVPFVLASAAAAAISVRIIDPGAMKVVASELGGEDVGFGFVSWRLIWAAAPGPAVFGLAYLLLSWPFPQIVGRASAIVFALTVDLPLLVLTAVEKKLNGRLHARPA